MNILPSIYRESVNFFEQSFLPTLTAQQQRIATVALFALGCLAACFALYYCVRNWEAKIVEEEKLRFPIEDPKDIPEVSAEAKAKYKQGMNVFAFEVLQEVINESPNDNRLISPLGISLLLSMIKHGVGSTEQAEIDRIAHLPQDSDEMKVSAFELIKKLKEMGFDFASLVCLNPQYRLNPDYQKIVSQYYQSRVEVSRPYLRINQWVEKITDGQIKEIVTKQDLGGVFVVVLANALHFKAKWDVPFEADETYKQKFTTPTKEVTVKMMHREGAAQYFEDENCQALKLGYSDAKDVSLVLILPKKDNDFSFVNEATFEKISKGFTSEEIGMAVPKFKLANEVNVKEMLEKMGIQEIFTKPDVSQLIDFGHEEPEEAYFSTIKQKSALACDEEGTEASTVTVAGMEETEPPPPKKEITFDRPFLAALVSKEAPVLFGVIRDPSAS